MILDKNHMIGNDRNKMDKNKLKLICIYVLHFNVFWFQIFFNESQANRYKIQSSFCLFIC